MSRYTGPVCKLCRREGAKLFLKGEKCHTKCVLDARPTAPGSARPQRGKPSEFAIRLREKQKLRRSAMVNERHLETLMHKAAKAAGATGEILLRTLETRLDNFVRRAGFVSSLKTARQLVSHGKVKVNGKRVNVSAYGVQPDDIVQLDERLRENLPVKVGLDAAKRRGNRPAYLEFDENKLAAKLLRWPSREEMSFPVTERLIVEYYSK